jgi:hypothetical protein
MHPVTLRLKTQQLLEDDKIYQLLSDCYQAVDKNSELFDRIGDELHARWQKAELDVEPEERYEPGDR